MMRCLWHNGYHQWKWTQQLEFKSWMKLFAFDSANTLEKGKNPIILPPR